MALFTTSFAGVGVVCVGGFLGSFISVRLPTVAEEVALMSATEACTRGFGGSFLVEVVSWLYVVYACECRGFWVCQSVELHLSLQMLHHCLV